MYKRAVKFEHGDFEFLVYAENVTGARLELEQMLKDMARVFKVKVPHPSTFYMIDLGVMKCSQ